MAKNSRASAADFVRAMDIKYEALMNTGAATTGTKAPAQQDNDVPASTSTKPTTPTTNPNGNIVEIIDVLSADGSEIYDISTGLII